MELTKKEIAMSRKIHIVGNWKMNHVMSDVDTFIQELEGLNGHDCETWIAPQFLHIPYFAKKMSAISNTFKVGAQNCSVALSGAYTGDISITALKDCGASFVIIGHSERRAIFGETHELLNSKTKLALEQDMTVIFCIGETLEQREQGITNQVLEEQLLKGLKDITVSQAKNIIIAYEPVWAIGTGKTATPQQAQDAHAFCRSVLKEKLKFDAEQTIILYGGSVKPSNVAELVKRPDIDGGLVGGASLKATDFKALCFNR